MTSGQPIRTLLIVAAAVLVSQSSWAQEALIFRRELIEAGEWWRLATGHWVHFSFSHLFWNGALIGIAGSLLETTDLRRWRRCLACSLGILGPGILLLAPGLSTYAGLSGIAAAFLTTLALSRLEQKTGPAGLWYGLLLALPLKIGLEAALASPLVATFSDAGIRALPQAHLLGMIAGGLAFVAGKSRWSIVPEIAGAHR
jgi:rhomboid family GlyGly-CTERM serine protease